jgi:hypothetical protein
MQEHRIELRDLGWIVDVTRFFLCFLTRQQFKGQEI